MIRVCVILAAIGVAGCAAPNYGPSPAAIAAAQNVPPDVAATCRTLASTVQFQTSNLGPQIAYGRCLQNYWLQQASK